MGKIILISGSNGSGKSRFAEELVSQTRGARYYVATMVSVTEENERRIEKHRRQREGLGFVTLEVPYQAGNAAVAPNSVVLLEDATNLLANAMFGHGGDAAAVYGDICTLAQRCRLLIVVTISGLCADEYEGETADYIRSVNELNRRLLERASAAVELRGGHPHWQKGDRNALD